MNYENITLEDFRNLSEDDFKKMPKKIYEKFIEEERKHIFRLLMIFPQLKHFPGKLIPC